MNHSPYQNPQFERNFSEKTCYICKTIGHLTHNCPITTPSPVKNQASSSRPQIFSGSDGETEARILCRKCGATAKPQEVVKSEKNRGKWYFNCMEKCKFVEWVEKVKPEEKIWVPKCKCLAGFCKLSVENSGPNAGRISFICPIKKGQGKCSFEQWADEAEVKSPINGVNADERINSFPLSTLTNCGGDNVSPASNSALPHQGLFSNKETEIESPTHVAVLDPITPPHGPQDRGSVSGLSKRTKTTTTMIVDEFEGETDISTGEESLRKHHKRFDPKSVASVLNFDISDWFEDTAADPIQKEDLHAPMSPRSNEEVNYKQSKFSSNIIGESTGSLLSNGSNNTVLPREDCLLTAAMLHDHSSKEHVERYNREKKCLDDISRDHAKAIADLEACKGRIETLDQRAATVSDMLFQIETELLCRKAENQILESEYRKVSTAKSKSAVEFGSASEAVGVALNRCQRMEEDRAAAEAALKKAKFLLRD